MFLEELESRELLAVNIDAFVVPSTGLEGQTMALSAQASTDVPGALLTYQWNFGDGSSQSGVDLTDVSHAYAAPANPGTPYTVTLIVSNGTDSATDTSTINITDVPPTVNAGPSQTIHAGDTASFNGSVSDPGGTADIASIQWDFNYDGQNFVADPSANGNLTPTHTYATAGTYLVALQATDQGGNVSQDVTTVTVKPSDALIVNAGPDLTLAPGQSVTLSGSYSDPGGTVDPSNIAWDTNYDGDTFNPVVTGTLTPTVSFSTPGSYQVALQITDSTGASDLSVLNVTVTPYVGPTANAGTDAAVNEGDTYTFGGSYTDPDGTVDPSSGIAWDFNYDGVTFNSQVTGTLTPSWQFTAPGTYTVALQVTDSNGVTNLSTMNLTVNAVTPTVSAGSDMTVTAGQLVSFNGSASDPGGSDDPLSYAWDFNYDGQNFNPGSANSLNPYYVFTTPGTYVVALQATDSAGVSGLSTINVTVNPSNSLVVNAGPDQALAEGDTASFSGNWTDATGITVDPSTAQWDFNYDGSTFNADPSAAGTLTPAHVFTTPGTYLVALQLTDSNNVTSIGTLYVSVADVAPQVDAGPDQTVAQGSTVSFSGTASKPAGASDALSYDWDFDYDGQNFVADGSAGGTLTPTHVFTTPGTYEVALQVTDAEGATSLATTTVTVTDVPPTATVTNSGSTPVGSAVTFTVSNLTDQTPGDTPTILADWDGSGQFEEITSDELTTNPDGSLSFTHVYDQNGSYNAVIRIMDGSGGYTDSTSSVTVTAVPPSVTTFGAAGGATQIDASAPILFTGVGDPSVADTQAGFAYYVSLDGAPYTSSSSPVYYLPSNISTGSHTLTGYVEDSQGQTSSVSSYSFDVESSTDETVEIENQGPGSVTATWGGGSTTLSPNQPVYYIDGSAPNLTFTLDTSGVSYVISTNGTIASVGAAEGVQNVTFTVTTQLYGLPAAVGSGDIDEVDVPVGSTVSAEARGDLGSVTGPSVNGALTGTKAIELSFNNLTGSITGLDSINSVVALGSLGAMRRASGGFADRHPVHDSERRHLGDGQCG